MAFPSPQLFPSSSLFPAGPAYVPPGPPILPGPDQNPLADPSGVAYSALPGPQPQGCGGPLPSNPDGVAYLLNVDGSQYLPGHQ